MTRLFVCTMAMCTVSSVLADEVAFFPASRDCVRSSDDQPLAPLITVEGGSPRGGTAIGTMYDVSHYLGTQNPMPACFPKYGPIPVPPDDIVLFDGVPEQARQLASNAFPIITEQEALVGPNTYQLTIQSQASPMTAQLFPGGQTGPMGQPLTDACFFIGLNSPLNYNGPKEVLSAQITFMKIAGPPVGPIDVSGPAFFSNPWNGTFGIRMPAMAATGVNGVVIVIVVRLGCLTDLDCDDGDPCTIDQCIDGVCFNFIDPDPCCGVDCDDGEVCTVDTCVNGLCVYSLLDCDDGDMCTVDSCEFGTGCVHKQLKDVLSREAALRASHGPAAPCFPSGSPPRPLPIIDPPIDGWMTNDACDGDTKWRIGLDPGSPPIPADFFGPGSEPFTGEIVFQGESLAIPDMANTDTVVRRSGDPFDRVSVPSGTDVTIEIELVQLSLVSCQPITVSFDGGATTSDWDVHVELSDCAPAPGTLTARKTHCNGGTFESVLPVQPKLTFTKVGDPGEIRVLDAGCVDPPYPADMLMPPSPVAWVHDIAPNLAAAAIFGTAFHAGFPEGQSTQCGDYDLDDDCDGDDFKLFLKAYGSSPGDSNYENYADYVGEAPIVINGEDFREWLSCYRCSVGDPTASAPLPGLLGDLNDDGFVRGDDAQGVVDCMLAGGPPMGLCDRADIDQDGDVDLNDTPGFVLLLLVLD